MSKKLIDQHRVTPKPTNPTKETMTRVLMVL